MEDVFFKSLKWIIKYCPFIIVTVIVGYVGVLSISFSHGVIMAVNHGGNIIFHTSRMAEMMINVDAQSVYVGLKSTVLGDMPMAATVEYIMAPQQNYGARVMLMALADIAKASLAGLLCYILSRINYLVSMLKSSYFVNLFYALCLVLSACMASVAGAYIEKNVTNTFVYWLIMAGMIVLPVFIVSLFQSLNLGYLKKGYSGFVGMGFLELIKSVAQSILVYLAHCAFTYLKIKSDGAAVIITLIIILICTAATSMANFIFGKKID